MTLATLVLGDINLTASTVVWWLVVGLIAGVLASFVMRGISWRFSGKPAWHWCQRLRWNDHHRLHWRVYPDRHPAHDLAWLSTAQIISQNYP